MRICPEHDPRFLDMYCPVYGAVSRNKETLLSNEKSRASFPASRLTLLIIILSPGRNKDRDRILPEYDPMVAESA